MSDARAAEQADMRFTGLADELAAEAADCLTVRMVDWGCGPYECHGARGVHRDLRLTVLTSDLRVDVTGAEGIPVTARGLVERDEGEAEFVLRLQSVQWTGRRLIADYLVQRD